MKKILTTVFALLMLCTIAFAQGTAIEKAQKQTRILSAKLELSDAQAELVYQATMKRIEAIELAQSAQNPDEAALKEARISFDKEMTKILSADQKTKFDTLKAERGFKMD